ncbi:hypothetical protein DL764_003271 [Monosporascus ibericus]|uniref:DUF7924 domain-containing protein n=1 Tax=Monosporascus ibericus TaxID=155417 RepID=A0A4Q4TKH9_9PEZI|nr:hypothetical protein DL764_003271 [Monosporascus ibericus]
MAHLIARKKAASNASNASNASSMKSNSATFKTPSDQMSLGDLSAPYRDSRYESVLEFYGSMMKKSDLDITAISKTLCRTLLETEQPVPKNSLFDDDIFESACQAIRGQNEARIAQDIGQLIVPSAVILAIRGAKHLNILTESVHEGWNNSIPLYGARPQPDYSVGFRRDAFTKDQLIKLSPFIGDFTSGDQSFFMATYYMYFPFLTCEVTSQDQLTVADRQNAHSMTLAVRAIVELFRGVKRESEVHRQILAFSISHDDSAVRIYGHYPVIDGKDTKYYRHPIHEFFIAAAGGREKWTAYRFTKNVYDTWIPAHFKNICSAIDQLPSDSDTDVPARSEAAGLPQDLGKPDVVECQLRFRAC